MHTFDVQGIEIRAPRWAVFDFVRDPHNLRSGRMRFNKPTINERISRLRPGPSLSTCVRSRTKDAGTIDWSLGLPTCDRRRAVPGDRDCRGTCIYSFVLHAPPVPLEQLEGALDAQRMTLREELTELKRLLEAE